MHVHGNMCTKILYTGLHTILILFHTVPDEYTQMLQELGGRLTVGPSQNSHEGVAPRLPAYQYRGE